MTRACFQNGFAGLRQPKQAGARRDAVEFMKIRDREETNLPPVLASR